MPSLHKSAQERVGEDSKCKGEVTRWSVSRIKRYINSQFREFNKSNKEMFSNGSQSRSVDSTERHPRIPGEGDKGNSSQRQLEEADTERYRYALKGRTSLVLSPSTLPDTGGDEQEGDEGISSTNDKTRDVK